MASRTCLSGLFISLVGKDLMNFQETVTSLQGVNREVYNLSSSLFDD
jgi:hypothetical protein